MQNFLLTSKKICPPQKNKIKNQQQKKKSTKPTKTTHKTKNPTPERRSCTDGTIENFHVLDVTFPFGGPILLQISVEKRFWEIPL